MTDPQVDLWLRRLGIIGRLAFILTPLGLLLLAKPVAAQCTLISWTLYALLYIAFYYYLCGQYSTTELRHSALFSRGQKTAAHYLYDICWIYIILLAASLIYFLYRRWCA